MAPGADRIVIRDWVRFVMRWQRLTGPVTAKGVEDTALYRWDGLLSRSEVGSEPGRPAVDPAEFHRRMRERQRRWPGSLNAGSTHDSKRSEDVRARLHVLSEIPDEWGRRLARWRRMNREHARAVRGGRAVPDPSFELHLYQTMVGVWPLDQADRRDLVPRLQDYALKAAREAKVHTSWLDQAGPYERALRGWVRAVLGSPRFRADLEAFVGRIGAAGAVNSLAAAVLRATAPGVPDVYQGTERWAFSLVDPDNRRPVDFDLMEQTLDALDEASPRAARRRLAGRPRQAARAFVRPAPAPEGAGPVRRGLVRAARGDRPAAGQRRRVRPAWRPRVGGRGGPSPDGRPDPRRAASPPGAARGRPRSSGSPTARPSAWRNVLTGETFDAAGGAIRVGDAFATLPVAVLVPTRR